MIGPIVFADAAARLALEAIVHPAVYRAIAAGLRAFSLTGDYPFAVADIPLLYETGAEKDFAHFCETTGCELLESTWDGGELQIALRKPG